MQTRRFTALNRMSHVLTPAKRKLALAGLLVLLLSMGAMPGVGAELSQEPPKMVALTFDDGPTPEHTVPILKTLAANNISATFFVLGKQVEQHPDLVKMAVDEGNSIAIHGYSHTSITELSPAALRNELDTTTALLRRLGVPYGPFFRPPRGIATDKELQQVERDGYLSVFWTFGIESVAAPTPEQMVARLMRRLGNRRKAVILLHDGYNIDRSTTVEALPLLINSLRAAGYTFVPFDRLVGEVVRHPKTSHFDYAALKAKWPF